MWLTMNRFINFLKYLFTTNIVDIEITFLHVFILAITLIWSAILFLILPLSFIASLFNIHINP